MPRTRFTSSLRARFAAATATVFALVALGGVTAPPAFADNVNVYAYPFDASTGYGYTVPFTTWRQTIVLHDLNGNQWSYQGDDSNGFGIGDVPEGDYYITVADPAYGPSDVIHLTTGVVRFTIDTFSVSGSIPADAANGQSTVDLQQESGGVWSNVGSTTVSSAGGAFSIHRPTPAAHYRFVVHPSTATDYLETVSADFVTDGASSSYSAGAITLLEAGVIRGVVLSEFGAAPIAGATVTVSLNGTDVGTGVTDGAGAYRVRVETGDGDYSVRASAAGYLNQEWDHSLAGTETVPINATAGYLQTGVNFVLETELVDVTGDVTSTGGPYAATTKLFQKSNTGNFAPVPVGKSTNSSGFSFAQLVEGDYRMTFTSPTSGSVLPVAGFDLNGAGYAAAPDDCYIDFTVDYDEGDIDVAQITVDPAASATECGNPTWLDPANATISGTVGNIGSFSGALTAQLFTGDDATPDLVASTTVDPTTGAYGFGGITALGSYIVRFVPYADLYSTDAMLDTLLGASGATAWAKDATALADFSADHYFIADPGDPDTLVGHDVVIDAAALIHGNVYAGASLFDGCVRLTVVTDPTDALCDTVDANGNYFFRVPAGGTYTLEADSATDEQRDQWWQNANSAATATPIGPVATGDVGTFDFGMVASNPVLYGFVRDLPDAQPVTMHLYYWDFNAQEWAEVSSAETDPGNGINQAVFKENYYTGLFDGLIPGDYRMRFEAADGTWLAATQYSTGTLPVAGAATAGPACFVDFASVTIGMPSYIDAEVDSSAADQGCAAEPLDNTKVSGHVQSSPLWANESAANQWVLLSNEDGNVLRTGTTDGFGNFSVNGVPNGTYTLAIGPGAHTVGTHDYTYTASGIVLSGAVLDLGTIVATRYGNAYGDISNWDAATMGAATATVYKLHSDPDGDYWQATGARGAVSSTGYFEASGIDTDGEYAVRIDFASTYAPVFIGGGTLVPLSPLSGIAEEDRDFGSSSVTLTNRATVAGTVYFGSMPLEGARVTLHAPGAPANEDVWTYTDVNGAYAVEALPDVDYEVRAEYTPLMIQVNSGHNYPYDYTGAYDSDLVAVGGGAVGTVNFSLVAHDDVVFELYVDQWHPATQQYTESMDVEVHLYKRLTDGWHEVDTEGTDPYSYLESTGTGDYRLRFSIAGEWVPLQQIEWDNGLPPGDDAYALFDPAACYYAFTSLPRGSYIYGHVSVVVDPAVECTDQPLLDGGVTPPAPPSTPVKQVTATPKTSTAGVAAPAPTSTPTATPTPTPSTTESGAATDEPDDQSVDGSADGDGQNAAAPDFTWVFWLSGVLVLLVIAGGAVFIIRRRG